MATFTQSLQITASPTAAPGLLWHDEFDSLSLYNYNNTAAGGTWMPGGTSPGFDAGTAIADSWQGNPFNPQTTDLSQLYSVSNSILRMNFIKTPTGDLTAVSNQPWCCGCMNTSPSWNHQYGYIEFKARMPAGAVAGVGGAFWLLASGMWPPEMDVNEWGGISGGTNQYQAATFTGAQGAGTVAFDAGYQDDVTGTSTTTWSNYAMDWNASTTTFYWNGVAKATGPTPSVAKTACYVILEMNSGSASQSFGNGPVTDPSKLPTYIEVDYVRWWDTRQSYLNAGLA